MIDASHPGERVDPPSVSQANQLAADSRRRVFIVFLDIENVDVAGSHAIEEPLIGFINLPHGGRRSGRCHDA